MASFNGKVITLPKGNLSYEIGGGEAEDIFLLVDVLQSRMGYEAALPIFGLDSAWMDMERDGKKITVGWDIWSDLFIFVGDKENNELVNEIFSTVKDEIENVLENKPEKKVEVK